MVSEKNDNIYYKLILMSVLLLSILAVFLCACMHIHRTRLANNCVSHVHMYIRIIKVPSIMIHVRACMYNYR